MTVIPLPESGSALLKQSVTGFTLPRLERMRAAYEDELNMPKALRPSPLSSVRRALAIVEAEITQRVGR